MTLQARSCSRAGPRASISVGFGHALLAFGVALWPRALADAATVSSSAANAFAALGADDGCQRSDLFVQLRVEVNTPATGPATRTSLVTVSLGQGNWCNATSRSFSASWQDVSSVRVSDAAQSASVSLTRNVTLQECNYADGFPNCSERSVPLALSLGWTARGQVTSSSSFQQNNLTGVVQRSFDADKFAAAQLSYNVMLDGSALPSAFSNANLSTKVSRQTEVTP